MENFMKIYSFLLLSSLAFAIQITQAMEERSVEKPKKQVQPSCILSENTLFLNGPKKIVALDIRPDMISGWNKIIAQINQNPDQGFVDIAPLTGPLLRQKKNSLKTKYENRIAKLNEQMQDQVSRTAATAVAARAHEVGITAGKEEIQNNLSTLQRHPKRSACFFLGLGSAIGITGLLAYQNPATLKNFVCTGARSVSHFFSNMFTRTSQVTSPIVSAASNLD